MCQTYPTLGRNVLLGLALAAVASAASATTFTVSNGADSGDGSLRAAILAANADASATAANPHVIVFSGVSLVTVSSPLPALYRPAYINVFGNQVRIRATSLVSGAGFRLSAGSAGSYVQNITVRCTSPLPCFSDNGIEVSGEPFSPETTLDLIEVDGVGGDGVRIDNAAVHVDRARIVRSRNGIRCTGSSPLRLTRSQIGLTTQGIAAGNSRHGVSLLQCSGTRIGGDAATAGNVISGNDLHGIQADRTESLRIEGNLIGLDPTGQSARGNGASGIAIERGSTVTIGGISASLGNTVAGNQIQNIGLSSDEPSESLNATIRHNRIGTRSDGSPLPAGDNPANTGVQAAGPVRLVLGGDGYGNLIRDHGGSSGSGRGVALLASGGSQAYATISQNSIHSNDGVAIFDQAGLPVPVLNPIGGTSLITGSVPGGLTGGRVEFYVDDWAQSRLYVGMTDVLSGNGSGGVNFSASINLSAHSGKRLTALYRSPPSGLPASQVNRSGALSAPVPIGPNILSVTLVGAATGERVESGPAGILCPGFCAAGYSSGTVSLVAFIGNNRQVNWSGDCTGSGICNVSMNTNRNVTATFGPAQRLLTVQRSGSGTVNSSPPGINCGSACQAHFNHGATVNLTATPAANHVFVSWGGACSGSSTCSVVMTSARTVEATFAPIQRTLTVQRTGQGTITSSPAGIDCGLACSATFAQGSSVQLDAVAAPGWQFASWNNCPSAVGTRCTLNLAADATIGATFTQLPPNTHALTVTRAGSGLVTSNPPGISCGSTCTAAYAEGTVVQLSATPAAGWSFGGWSGACTGTGACSVTMTQARAVTANFVPPVHALTVNRTGQGRVTSAPSGIDCGSACTATFNEGTLVELSATPAAGWQFTGYSGACAGSTCVLTMSQARTVTASFTQLPPTNHVLNVTRTGLGNVTSTPAGIACGGTCSAAFPEGTAVNLGAVPAAGWQFVGWGGACNGQGGCTVTMDQARSVSATFAQIPPDTHPLTVTRHGEGVVSSVPAGILCGDVCSGSFVAQTLVTLSAEATAGWSFQSWGGACQGAIPSCSVTMNQARAVTATFAPISNTVFDDGFE